MPEKMASHWNGKGQVDGYIPKFWGLFLMPLVYVGLALLFFAIPKIDPLKANIERFRKYYDGFIILLFVFLVSVDLQDILWNLGIKISPNVTFPIGLGLLFFYIGILCEHSKRNWFIGIRTPWTLSSEKVWDKTTKSAESCLRLPEQLLLLGCFSKTMCYFSLLFQCSWLPFIPLFIRTLNTKRR
jgi:uncharacterized membrane protein